LRLPNPGFSGPLKNGNYILENTMENHTWKRRFQVALRA
jgi:hypothetical protein